MIYTRRRLTFLKALRRVYIMSTLPIFSRSPRGLMLSAGGLYFQDREDS